MRDMLESGKSWVVDIELDLWTQSLDDCVWTDPECVHIKVCTANHEMT